MLKKPFKKTDSDQDKSRMPRGRGSEKYQGKTEQPEFEQKVLDIRRVARVVAGGRRFTFRATVAVGNRLGRVGVGAAKGLDVSQAVTKAVHQAKQHLITVFLKNATIPHEVRLKYGAVKLLLKPAAKGRGLVAGSVVRALCDLAGIKDISVKIISRSTNKLNNARAVVEAFKQLRKTS